MPQNFANNAQSTLAAAITSSATSFNVASAASFPAAPFVIVIDSEILNVTAVSGVTFTVQRAQEGTTAAAHASGATVLGAVTAGALKNLARAAHVGSSTPSGGVSGDIAVGTGKLWVNDGGVWKSIALSDQPAASAGFYVGVVTVQNETSAGRARLGTGGLGVWGGHHTHGFAANNTRPSDINTFFGQMGTSIPKILYAALGPTSLSTTDPWVNPDTNRLSSTANVQAFADDVISYCQANSSIKAINFWNEMKGYNWGDNDTDRTLFYNHYITFATRVKATLPNMLIGGPYSTGGLSDSVLQAIHNGFITNVIQPNVGLVDFIAWDHSGATDLVGGIPRHQWYTDMYVSQGVTLPHMNTEWYPGGWNTSSPLSVGNYARAILNMAQNPYMRWAMHWGGGSDAAMKSTLWNSSGTGTAYWSALNTVASFTSKGNVTNTSANTWTNATNQTLTVSGDTITVA